MKYAVFILLAVVGLLMRCPLARESPPEPTNKRPWHLVWSDEFADGRVDRGKWNVIDGEPNYDGGINVYTAGDVAEGGGKLVIRSRTSKSGKTFYSGKVTTRGQIDFHFGKIEVRARLPGTQGIWPAIWMLPSDRTWPPEIDIMEMLGNAPQTVYMTNHWPTKAGPRQDQDSFTGPDFTADFHVFTLEWEPNSLRWLIDGRVVKEMTAHVPDRPMYLRINTSVGGEWPGNPNKNTVWPQYFTIDYVRIYQR